MIITKLEVKTARKVNVYIDDIYTFWLYKNEQISLGLEEEKEIFDAEYDDIVEKVVLKRAKQKALDLLKVRDRTRVELYKKLSLEGYNTYCVEKAVEYVESYGYINDLKYATSYIEFRKHQKSKKKIIQELYQKGVEKEVLNVCINNIYSAAESDKVEEEALASIVRKKVSDVTLLSTQEKQKLAVKLYRKGFTYGDISKYLELQ